MSPEQSVQTETPKRKETKVPPVLRVALRLVGVWCVYLLLMHQGARVMEEGLLEYPLVWGLQQAGVHITRLEISADVYLGPEYFGLGELKEVAMAFAQRLGLKPAGLELLAEAEAGFNRVRAYGEEPLKTVAVVATSFGGEHWVYDQVASETILSVHWIEGAEDRSLDVWSSRRKIKRACRKVGELQSFHLVFVGWFPGVFTHEDLALLLDQISGHCRDSSEVMDAEQLFRVYSPRLAEVVTLPQIGAVNVEIRTLYDPQREVTYLRIGVPTLPQ